uniref:Uncharacterized protein n=1 Tax=Ascaris lumbricoides TaxID=6252 RepID=A0A0M3ICY3_ASCLU
MCSRWVENMEIYTSIQREKSSRYDDCNTVLMINILMRKYILHTVEI